MTRATVGVHDDPVSCAACASDDPVSHVLLVLVVLVVIL